MTTERTTDDLTRRSLLRKGALATGAVGLSGVAMGSVAASPNGGGGVAYIPGKTYRAMKGSKFRIGSKVPAKKANATLEHSASCNGNGATKTYRGYTLLNAKGMQAGVMYVNPERNVNSSGTQWYTFHNGTTCSGNVVQANYRPTSAPSGGGAGARSRGNAGGGHGGVAYFRAKTYNALTTKNGKPVPFRIGKRLPNDTLEHSASCNGHGATKTYQGYAVLNRTGTRLGVLYVDPDRKLATGSDRLHVVHNGSKCSGTPPVYQANFRPAE